MLTLQHADPGCQEWNHWPDHWNHSTAWATAAPECTSSVLVVIIIYSFKKYHQVFHFMRNQSYSWVKNKLAHFPRQKKPKVSIFDDVWETQQLSVNCLRRRNPGSSLLRVFWSAPLTTGNVQVNMWEHLEHNQNTCTQLKTAQNSKKHSCLTGSE